MATDFDDPTARWRSVHGVFTVERELGGATAPQTLAVSMPLYDKADFQKFEVGLRALGKVVLFLESDSPLTTYDPTAFVVAQNHVFIAKVHDDDHLSLPMMPAEEAAALLAPAVRTLADLERAARTPRRIALAPGPHPDLPMRAAA